VEAATVAWVAFAVGRWGSRTVVTAAVVSVPGVFVVGTGLAVLSRLLPGYYYADVYPAGIFSDGPLDGRGLAGGTVLVLAGLLLPLLGGLALRSQAEADTSRRSQAVAEEERERAETQAEQATEIARLREEQTRLSRDVHDVVGHSLAVILAQAESAQFLPDDPAQLKATLATIATSARSSLRDVRQVLSPAAASAAAPPAGAMELLVDGVRSGGRTVEVDEVGTPRPLPPELDVVAHRVLQEMLTNAVKHGARDRPVRLERHWPTGGFEHDLRLEVSNVEDQPGDGTDRAVGETQPLVTVDASGGTGIDGMRRRLESVGGRLDVRRRTHDGTSTFTATAWVPVSGRADG
jgi:signal transduction histidine kinase